MKEKMIYVFENWSEESPVLARLNPKHRMQWATHNYDSFADHIKSRNDILEGIRY